LACPPAPVRDNGRSNLHDWFPIRVCHVSDEHFAFPEVDNVLDILNDMSGSLANLAANRMPLDKEFSFFLELILLEHVPVLLALHCLWPCLDNEQLAAVAIFCPFHIHRLEVARFLLIMFFNYNFPPCKNQHL